MRKELEAKDNNVTAYDFKLFYNWLNWVIAVSYAS